MGSGCTVVLADVRTGILPAQFLLCNPHPTPEPPKPLRNITSLQKPIWKPAVEPITSTTLHIQGTRGPEGVIMSSVF